MSRKADKEIVVFLTNGGKQPLHGDLNYFEKAKEVMKLIIEKKIFLRSKDEVAVALAGRRDDDITEDDSGGRDEFYQDIRVPTWQMVKNVQKLKSSNEIVDDWYTTIINTLKRLEEIEYACRIILILLFDCHSECEGVKDSDTRAIAESIQKQNIHLLWIGSKPLKDLPENKLNKSEKLLMNIIELANGEYMTMDKTLSALRIFKHNKMRFIAWKCNLEIGGIKIPTSMYNQATKSIKTTTFQTVMTKGRNDTEKTMCVDSEREYVDRFKKAHPIENTISGYMFGRNLIPVTDADKLGMIFDGGPKSLKVWGFTRRDAIALEDLAGETSRIVIPESPYVMRQFYCLLQAMIKSNLVAIVRRVYQAKNCPKMGILVPHAVPDEAWGFNFIEILYAEERRVQKSRPHETVKKRLTDEKLNAVENLIDSMMLDSPDDEPEPFYPGTVHSPGLQHIYNCLSHRALNPDEPVPDMEENLKKLLESPESVRISSESAMKRLKVLFPIPDEQVLEASKAESKHNANEVPVPVLREVKKMEEELADNMKLDVPLATEDVDLDELFDEDMSM